MATPTGEASNDVVIIFALVALGCFLLLLVGLFVIIDYCTRNSQTLLQSAAPANPAADH